MSKRVILWYLGISMLFVSIMMAVSGIIAFLTPGDDSRIPLLYGTVITALIGAFPLIFIPKSKEKINFKEGNCIIVGSWCFACLFGMIPFMMYAGEFTPVNALFESVSGFTTTGASILNDIEALPRGLQFWRISTAWVGGIGIVTLFSMIVTGRNKLRLTDAEMSSVARQTFEGDRTSSFAKRMMVTYVSLTLITFFALKLCGLPWFDSATTAMSACSTCGFCIKNTSIAFYNSPAVEIVLTFAMLASGINFGILFLTFVRGSHRNLFKSEPIRVFLILVAGAMIVVAIDLIVQGDYSSKWDAALDAAFQVASISTTTGFATKDTTTWPPLTIAILLVCSLICGCSGSTSGGIKIDRLVLAIKGIQMKIGRGLHPNMVQTLRVDNVVRPYEHVTDAFGYICCYLIIIVICGAINIAFGLDLASGLSASIACMGNVGPGFGEVGSMANYAAVPTIVKLSSMAEMLIGRLEIFPVLYLIRSVRSKA